MASPRRRYKKRVATKKAKLRRYAKIFVVRTVVCLILLFAAFVMKLVWVDSTSLISSAINSNVDIQRVQSSVTELILRYTPEPPEPPEPVESIEASS